MLQIKILSLSNLSLFESETIFSWKIISERNYCYGFMPGDFQVIRRSPVSAETSGYNRNGLTT